MSHAHLKYQQILVTRPAHQAGALCAAIRSAGSSAVTFPVIEIGASPEAVPAQQLATEIDASQWVIFISANAVTWGQKSLEGVDYRWDNTQIAAVGRKTAKVLQKSGLKVDLIPQDFNSESLLAEAAFQTEVINAKQIVIIQGEGGRGLLAETLQQRGAQVLSRPVYQRQCPQPDWSVHAWVKDGITAQGPIDCILCTSGEGLQNLVHLLQSAPWLWQTPLLLLSTRLVSTARALGFQAEIHVATEASDAGLIAALQSANDE